MKQRNAWDNSRHWSVSYRTQREADLPQCDFREEVRPRHWAWLAGLFLLLVVGPAVPDLIEWLI